MSAREAWNALLAQSLPETGRVLWLGDKRLSPAHALRVRELAEIAPGSDPFHGIGWVARRDVRAQAKALRAWLVPGAALLVVLDQGPVLGALSRALRLVPKAEADLFTELCEALLLAGLREPRLVASGRPCTALLATKPLAPAALDAFFEQPPA